MRSLITIALACVLALAVCGCCKRTEEQTTAIPVQNPKEKAAAPAAPPAPAPGGPAAQPSTPPSRVVDGWTVAASGLRYRDTKTGSGLAARTGDRVTVHYKGWLDNGKVFDTSRKVGGEPFQFVLGSGGVIRGWDEGLAGMKVGGVRQLVIPPELGYGNEEQISIPANSTLHFEVELLNVQRS